MYFNGSTTAGLNINLTGSVPNNDVRPAQSNASATILAQADQTNGGDGSMVTTRLYYVRVDEWSVVDAIGQIVHPGTEWAAG